MRQNRTISNDRKVRPVKRKSAAKPKKPFLSVKEAAKEGSLGVRLMYEIVESGALPTLRTGNRVYVNRCIFERWLAGEDVRPTRGSAV